MERQFAAHILDWRLPLTSSFKMITGALPGGGESVHSGADQRDAAHQAEGDVRERLEETGGGLRRLCE